MATKKLDDSKKTKKIDSNKTKRFNAFETEPLKSEETKAEEKITKLLYTVPANKSKKTTILKEFDLQLLTVIEIRDVNPKTKIYRLKAPANKKLPSFKAGQYIEIKTKIDGVLYSRKYSLCSSPRDAEKYNYYEIMVQCHTNSIVSKKIFNDWKVGTNTVSSYPIGNFYYWDDFEYKNICAITNSVGVAPILSLAKSIDEGDLNVTITIFNTAKTEEDLLLKDEFARLDADSNKVKVINVLNNTIKPGFEKGPIDIDIIHKHCVIKDCTFYICGMKSTCDNIINKITNKTTRHIIDFDEDEN